VTGPLDEQEQRTAARLEKDHPGWLIMWGYHTRLYWAFPRFNAQPGTVIAARGTGELLTLMHQAELAAWPGRSS
jgi:hypothetical protein